MREITDLYDQGIDINEIAQRYDITPGSAMKKIKLTHRSDSEMKASPNFKVSLTVSHRKSRIWDIATIKAGIDEFIAKNGRMPTANDFSLPNKLPSARQVQRMFGGLEKLRKELGYKEQNFTKGRLRKRIAIEANVRGLEAEDAFEPILIEKFGEPYVHVQKRYYKGSKNRYDFLVYAKNRAFGIDIFTTSRSSYIVNNIRHKIVRYKNAPKELSIYFVLIGNNYTTDELARATNSIAEMSAHPNMSVLTENDFLYLLESFESLLLPENFYGLESIELL